MQTSLGLVGNQYNLALMVFFLPYALLEVPANLLLKKLRPSVSPHDKRGYWLTSVDLASIHNGGLGLRYDWHRFRWELPRTGYRSCILGECIAPRKGIATECTQGVAEAGQYPGCAFYLTTFYRREDLAFRYVSSFKSTTLLTHDRQGLFFSAASAAGAFSGLLAYGISFMDGISGLEGWQWM